MSSKSFFLISEIFSIVWFHWLPSCMVSICECDSRRYSETVVVSELDFLINALVIIEQNSSRILRNYLIQHFMMDRARNTLRWHINTRQKELFIYLSVILHVWLYWTVNYRLLSFLSLTFTDRFPDPIERCVNGSRNLEWRIRVQYGKNQGSKLPFSSRLTLSILKSIS